MLKNTYISDNNEENCDNLDRSSMDTLTEMRNLEEGIVDCPVNVSEESCSHNETKENNYFFNLYKHKGESSQSKRREELLKEQKRLRNNLVDISRGINTENVIEEDTKPYKYKFKKYFNKLMMSEWLLEVPEDLETNWFLKICPVGHRCLVEAHKHNTKCFSKKGHFEEKFQSLLPGGDKQENFQKRTILDCVWDSKNECFYVLDVLMWAGHDITDYNAEFRFFWLQSQLKDIYEINVSSENNTYPFKYIDHYSSDQSTIHEQLTNYTENIDGLLFYHRDSSYTHGHTPLVGWLKTYMVPEILKISVNDRYLLEKPEKYIDLKSHIEYGNRLRSRKKNKESMMETEQVEH